ncbi:hypothetical protein ACLOJK_034179 [Asimina triloba]
MGDRRCCYQRWATSLPHDHCPNLKDRCPCSPLLAATDFNGFELLLFEVLPLALNFCCSSDAARSSSLMIGHGCLPCCPNGFGDEGELSGRSGKMDS